VEAYTGEFDEDVVSKMFDAMMDAAVELLGSKAYHA
jgi:hypothetical protein